MICILSNWEEGLVTKPTEYKKNWITPKTYFYEYLYVFGECVVGHRTWGVNSIANVNEGLIGIIQGDIS